MFTADRQIHNERGGDTKCRKAKPAELTAKDDSCMVIHKRIHRDFGQFTINHSFYLMIYLRGNKCFTVRVVESIISFVLHLY